MGRITIEKLMRARANIEKWRIAALYLVVSPMGLMDLKEDGRDLYNAKDDGSVIFAGMQVVIEPSLERDQFHVIGPATHMLNLLNNAL